MRQNIAAGPLQQPGGPVWQFRSVNEDRSVAITDAIHLSAALSSAIYHYNQIMTITIDKGPQMLLRLMILKPMDYLEYIADKMLGMLVCILLDKPR